MILAFYREGISLKPIEVDAALTQRIISLSSARESYRAGKF